MVARTRDGGHGPPTNLFDAEPATGGEAIKQAALDRHKATPGDLLILARRAMLVRLLAGQAGVTADDIRADVPVPAGVNPVALGGAPGELARSGIIRRSGYTASRRPTSHARPTAVWALIDRAAAERWLATHPAPAAAAATGG